MRLQPSQRENCLSIVNKTTAKLETRLSIVFETTGKLETKAATILRLLGSETIHFNTRGRKSEPGLRKQLNIDVKSTTKFIFFFKYMNTFIYFTNIRHFHFSILYFKYLQTLVLCITTFYKMAFYITYFEDASNLAI